MNTKVLILTGLMAISVHTASAETTEYFDPVIGEFSSEPPEGVEPITRSQKSEPTPEPEQMSSTLPGGGVAAETPEVRHDDN